MAFPRVRDYSVGMDDFLRQQETTEEQWCALAQGYGRFPSKAGARTRALVLDSRSIPCCIDYDGKYWQLLVPVSCIESASRELRLYEDANRNWPPRVSDERKLIDNTMPTVSVLVLLATFYNLDLLGLSLPGRGIIPLKELGTAHAGEIASGSWWQCITALTLHADLTHLLSNLTIGGVFIVLLCRELGSGLAWSMLIASGALGNLVNAWVQTPVHRSVGASTAVFGTVGILAAVGMMRYRNHLQRRWFVPVAAGLALLAILGTEGKHTDLGAHLFGFCSGLVLGSVMERIVEKKGRPGAILNVLLALLSGGAVAAAWWAALKFGV